MAFLPGEPEILAARQGFADAQADLADAVLETLPDLYECGWYGTSVSRERGAFALVNRDGALTDLVGDRLRLTAGDAEVFVYCFGTEALDYDIHITRRAFAALGLLATEKFDVRIEVLSA